MPVLCDHSTQVYSELWTLEEPCEFYMWDMTVDILAYTLGISDRTSTSGSDMILCLCTKCIQDLTFAITNHYRESKGT